MRYVALDPGLTTGFAAWYPELGEFEADELTVTEVYDQLMSARSYIDQTQLVIESFTITANTAKNTQAAWSLELIGAAKMVAWEQGWPAPKMQSPALAKTFGTNDKLKLQGWWHKGGAGHANDAARHLLTYCAQRRETGAVSDETLRRFALA